MISFCTTCMGRLWQVRQTLPENLRLFRGRSDVQWVLLDYGSQDGLEEWVRQTKCVRAAIDSGLLLYAKVLGVTTYHSSKAKNLAHRLATGDVLFNLDADNWAQGLDPAIKAAFRGRKDIVFHGHNRQADGSFGRIGLSREWFYRLGGYDESFLPMAYQDQDLLDRAEAAGLVKVTNKMGRPPIRNCLAEKVAHTGAEQDWWKMFAANKRTSIEKLARQELAANAADGWGAATVSINFGPPTDLKPIQAIAPWIGFDSTEMADIAQTRTEKVRLQAGSIV